MVSVVRVVVFITGKTGFFTRASDYKQHIYEQFKNEGEVF